MPAAAMDMSKSTGNSVVCQSHQTAAESVFARVLQLVQANDLADSSRQEWLKRNSTILDVQEEVRKAQDKYNIRTQGRARKWLARFSGSVLNYGQILDVLVQHHPEYVSLAWGTTKLFFVVGPFDQAVHQAYVYIWANNTSWACSCSRTTRSC